MTDFFHESCDNRDTKTMLSELFTEDIPDEDNQNCLLINGFKVNYAIIKEKIKENGDESSLEDCLEILAVRSDRYYKRVLSNLEALEISKKTSKISKSITDIHKMLLKAAENHRQQSFKVEISDEGVLVFSSSISFSWSNEVELDYLEIQLEEEHLEPLELSRRILKSATGLNKTCLKVFNNFINHSDKVQQEMATKTDLAKMEEDLQGSIKPIHQSITQTNSLLTTAQTEIAGLKEREAKMQTQLGEIAGLKEREAKMQTQLGEIAGLKEREAKMQAQLGEIAGLKEREAKIRTELDQALASLKVATETIELFRTAMTKAGMELGEKNKAWFIAPKALS